MNRSITQKSSLLDSILAKAGRCVVAFSGGVDSSFLLYRAKKVLGTDNVLGIVIRTPYIPAKEIHDSLEFASLHDILVEIKDIDIPDVIIRNPHDRCYLCKNIIFTQIKKYAKETNADVIHDGTNADDMKTNRPGLKSLAELRISSPLAEAALSKPEIRELAKLDGLNIWDKPAMACLMTRLPYDHEVTPEMFTMIEDAENILFENGYPGARVRLHNNIARIECLPGFIDKIAIDSKRGSIVNDIKKLGYRYVTLDLEGYRTGSMDD